MFNYYKSYNSILYNNSKIKLKEYFEQFIKNQNTNIMSYHILDI